ncbi:MAG: proprotein convertase P-domain-containing protein, partial [Saprospiraceae bacterium]|nr:proprotein convertase P-domain-containing protein [Saprospiraceae bacterium]
ITASEAPSMVAYWNFFNSSCRQPNSPASGGGGNGSLSNFNTGSVLKATYSPSDFTLVQLDDPIPATANAFFAGWSAEDFAPGDTVIAIHHPNTDEKRISFEFDPTFVSDYNGSSPNPNGTHITIPDWDIGTTEGGSSGSPLFNNQKRVVGQLHGGFAACGNNELDSYGWFHRSWTGGGAIGNSLKPWLDPDNTGIITLDGRAALQCSYFVEGTPTNISICAPAEVVYSVNVSANFTSNVTLSAANLPAGITATFAQNPVAPGGSTTLTLSGTASLAEGTYGFKLEGTDGTESNSANLQFFVAPQAPAAPALTFPTDGATGIGLTPSYQWAASPNTKYTIEIATDAAFSNIIETATNLINGSYSTAVSLISQNTYYWRVRGENICGQGEWPAVPNSFTTGAVTCSTLASVNVPVTISQAGGISVTSTLNVTSSGFVDDINLTNLYIMHTWVGDLRVELTSPSGTTIAIFGNPNSGDCQDDDISVSFDDEASFTYADFSQACSNNVPAIEGSFQPLELLSAFNGQPAAGVWTLTVYDDVNQDGGALQSWGLDISTTEPNDMSVTPSATTVSGCSGASVTFTAQLGTAFDESGGVTLAASGLPPGATATITPNPAQPGAQVTVVVSGTVTPGNYSFDLTATDAMNNTATATVQWNVLSEPAAPTTISPAPNATDVSTSPVFSWSNVGTSYQVSVATDINMTNPVFQGTSTQASLIANGLEPCTSYYWSVSAANQCGVSLSTDPQLFTTLDDLSFNVAQSSISSCPTGNSNVSLNIGKCFSANGVTLAVAGLPTGASASFLQNPVPPNTTQSIAISLSNVAPGSYNITVTGNDGVHTVSENFTLVVTAFAAAPTLVAPANGITQVNVKPTLDWNTVAGATSYFVEVATDPDFNDVVFFTSTSQSVLTLVNALNVNTVYYWHVYAFNSCGQGLEPVAFSFTTWPVNSTTELNGLSVNIAPNPTSGLVNAVFSKTTEEKMDATLHSVNGVLLKEQTIAIGSKSVSFDLSAMPTGVYLLRLRSESGVLTKKIVLEK